MMRFFSFLFGGYLALGLILAHGESEKVLFEDNFDKGLSPRWKIVGLSKEDYRLRDGGLEVRVQPGDWGQDDRVIKIELPFQTADTVIASVEVTPVGDPLGRGESAGVSLFDESGSSFTARKTNLDGYFVFAPGEVDFIGKEGQEGDPGKYAVKFWPADQSAGPLRITIRQHYAHFQTGPDGDGKYRTYFHSAIRERKSGMGFQLFTSGRTKGKECWVRFENFRVERP